MANSKSTKQKNVNPNASVTDVTRSIPDLDRLQLFVRAGGRCEFDGCNRYLLEHHVTLREGNFAQMAHIVAFSPDGPRGDEARPADINDIENLMVLCPACHKLIDDQPENFSKITLVNYKKEHERRIKHVTDLGPDQKTSLLVVQSRIGSQTVAIPFDHVLEAISPRYPYSRDGLKIDLTPLSVDSPTFVASACDSIKEQLQFFFGPSGEFRKTSHVSLFALAPIPILAFLGTQLSNKVPTDLYQRHRDTEKWTWKSGTPPVEYAINRLQKGSGNENVAVLLSLSGTIDQKGLPAEIDGQYAVYELTLANASPNPTFLNTKLDLEAFRIAYQKLLGTILRDSPGLKTIHMFPAVPAPVAVLCGRELLPKVHPSILLYDKDKAKGGFTYQITLNQT